MRLYFRADSRKPQTIFQKGFMPKKPYSSLLHYGNRWWQLGIRGFFDSDSQLPKTSATDAEMNSVVCLSKKLESTPMFPVCDFYHRDYDSEIYIYFMALPDAELPDDSNSAPVVDVFDLQAYQTQEVKEILGNSKLAVNPAIAGYFLSGHEVFTKEVSTQNIICAVKCKRSDFAFTVGVPAFTKHKDDNQTYLLNQARHFELGHEIFVNKDYAQDKQYKDSAFDEIRNVRAKGLQPTTRVEDALEDCGIAYDKKQIHTTTYFWHELTSLHFGMAFFSILESIYYAAIQLIKYMQKKPEQKPEEIIENSFSFTQEVNKKMSLSFYGKACAAVTLDPILRHSLTGHF